MKMPKLMPHLLNLLDGFIFLVLMAFFYPHDQFKKLNQDSSSNFNYQDSVEEEDIDCPSPLMVPVPFTSPVISKLIKKKLPVVEFSNFLKQSRAQEGQDSTLCAICLNCIEKSQEIREPANCNHVYHRKCIDGWLDHGQLTCPLCRLKLLPASSDSEGVKAKNIDPWRMERIAYLFGEDYVLG